MQKINTAQYFLPLIFIALVAAGLVACTGNNSSTTFGLLALIDPIDVNKTISTVEWSQSNEVEMASNAYRAISKNSPIRAIFTNKLVPLDLSVDLFPLLEDRNCRISGGINFEIPSRECFDDSGTNEVDCPANGYAAITINSQLSEAVACQDGNLSGQYIDGFFNIIKKVDLTESTEFRTSTSLSAINKISRLDEPDVNQRSDYLFQNDVSILFFDNEYETYIDLTTCDSPFDHRIARTGMRSPNVGFLEGDGADTYYPYTRYTALDLVSTPIDVCDGNDDYTYNLSAIMANAAMGGGVDRNTQVTWSNMDISLAGEPSGILTLTHKNEGGDYELMLDFNTEGQVTIAIPSSNNPITLLLAEFLAKSQP
ncbi:MAG: hypothetical protein ACI910_002315 [Oleispira sp.]|jgi:hypothetical protein